MNRFFKILLVSTSIAPILLTYWFIEQVNSWNTTLSLFENILCNWKEGIYYLLATVTLLLIFGLIIRFAKSRLEELPVIIEEIKTADNESVAFIIIYLLPLANGISDSFSFPILVFVAIIFFFIVMTSNAYHFNPLLNLIGYHFYEAKIQGGITYILLSKKNITNSKSINSVFHLTEYMILEKTEL
jgi:hypothetical protein